MAQGFTKYSSGGGGGAPQNSAPPLKRIYPYRDAIVKSQQHYDLYEMIRRPNVRKEIRPPDPPPIVPSLHLQRQIAIEKRLKKHIEKQKQAQESPGFLFAFIKIVFFIVVFPPYFALVKTPQYIFNALYKVISFFNSLISFVDSWIKSQIAKVFKFLFAPIGKIISFLFQKMKLLAIPLNFLKSKLILFSISTRDKIKFLPIKVIGYLKDINGYLKKGIKKLSLPYIFLRETINRKMIKLLELIGTFFQKIFFDIPEKVIADTVKSIAKKINERIAGIKNLILSTKQIIIAPKQAMRNFFKISQSFFNNIFKKITEVFNTQKQKLIFGIKSLKDKINKIVQVIKYPFLVLRKISTVAAKFYSSIFSKTKNVKKNKTDYKKILSLMLKNIISLIGANFHTLAMSLFKILFLIPLILFNKSKSIVFFSVLSLMQQLKKVATTVAVCFLIVFYLVIMPVKIIFKFLERARESILQGWGVVKVWGIILIRYGYQAVKEAAHGKG